MFGDVDEINELLMEFGVGGEVLDDVSVAVDCDEGCIVEWDGVCSHGVESPLRQAGMI